MILEGKMHAAWVCSSHISISKYRARAIVFHDFEAGFWVIPVDSWKFDSRARYMCFSAVGSLTAGVE